MKKIGPQGWILNTQSTFPLTVRAPSEAAAEEMRTTIESHMNDRRAGIKALAAVIDKHGIKCREVEYNRGLDPDEREPADLIYCTYVSAAIHYAEMVRAVESGGVKGFNILASADACDKCQEAAAKTYGLRNIPRVPVHLGCECTFTVVLKESDD